MYGESRPRQFADSLRGSFVNGSHSLGSLEIHTVLYLVDKQVSIFILQATKLCLNKSYSMCCIQ